MGIGDLMKTFALALGIFGCAAAASACPTGPSVDSLSCAQARQFASNYGCYWVDHRDGNGPLPIYPVYASDQVSCGPDQRANPLLEVTADSMSCAVGYQCIQNPHR